MRRNGLTFILWMIPSLTYAVGFLTYDTAQTLQPQQAELSGGFAAGDRQWVGQIGGRLGLRPDLDIHFRTGLLIMDKTPGQRFTWVDDGDFSHCLRQSRRWKWRSLRMVRSSTIPTCWASGSTQRYSFLAIFHSTKSNNGLLVSGSELH